MKLASYFAGVLSFFEGELKAVEVVLQPDIDRIKAVLVGPIADETAIHIASALKTDGLAVVQAAALAAYSGTGTPEERVVAARDAALKVLPSLGKDLSTISVTAVEEVIAGIHASLATPEPAAPEPVSEPAPVAKPEPDPAPVEPASATQPAAESPGAQPEAVAAVEPAAEAAP